MHSLLYLVDDEGLELSEYLGKLGTYRGAYVRCPISKDKVNNSTSQ